VRQNLLYTFQLMSYDAVDKWCEIVMVHQIHGIGSRLDQNPDHVNSTVEASVMERYSSVGIYSGDIDSSRQTHIECVCRRRYGSLVKAIPFVDIVFSLDVYQTSVKKHI